MKNFKGNIFLLLAALIWGFAFVAQSEGLNYVGPFTFNGIRSIIGGIVLLPVALLTSKKTSSSQASSKKGLIVGGIVCGIFLAVATSLQQIGLGDPETTAGKAGFITALYIIIVPVFQIFCKKKIGKKTVTAIIVAIIGMYLLCLSDGIGSFAKGDLYVLACAFVFSGHIMAIDKYSPKTNGVALSCVQFLTSGILCSAVMFIFESPDMSDIIAAAIPLLYTGVLSCGVAYTFQIIGQKHTSPTLATIIMSLESVFAALGGWMVLGEKMNTPEKIGSVLMFAAIIFAQLPDGFLRNSLLKKKD